MTQGRGNVIDFDDIFGMALPNSNPQNANGKASGTSIKKQLFKSGTALRRISNSARTKAKENIEKSISTLLTKSDNGGVVDKVKPLIESLTSHANSFIISSNDLGGLRLGFGFSPSAPNFFSREASEKNPPPRTVKFNSPAFCSFGTL